MYTPIKPAIMDVTRWDSYVKDHLLKPENGFAELPYLSNNAEVMIESMCRLPISQHKSELKSISTKNDFLTGEMRYRELQEGLWILASNIAVKKNIISKALYDPSVQSDYYFLSFAVFDYPFPVQGKNAAYSTLVSTTCTFYKPNTEVHTYFYERTKGTFFNLVFTKKWAETHIHHQSGKEKAALDFFLNDEAAFLNWINIVPDAVKLSASLWERLEIIQGEEDNTTTIRQDAYTIISDFFVLAYEEERLQNFSSIHNPDFACVAQAEQLILLNLSEPFLGVEEIARAVNLSSTKLKRIFKAVFGFSMLQYHKEKNMLLAQQLLKHSGIAVGSVATIAGYNSPSKFTAAFKKRFGTCPAHFREL